MSALNRLSYVIESGLIKVPQSLMNACRHYVERDLLWYWRDRFTPTLRNKYIKPWGILYPKIKKANLPNKPFVLKEGYSAYILPIPYDELPKAYQLLTPKYKKMTLVINFSNDDISPATNIAYVKRGKEVLYLVINLRSRWLSVLHEDRLKDDSPNDFKHSIDTIMGTVHHELQHVMQYALFLDFEKQMKMHKNYDEHTEDYLLSPIEFDPTIQSEAHDFVTSYLYFTNAHKKKINLDEALRKSAGIVPSKPMDLYKPSAFFKVLKKRAPKRYKIAVKKYIAEVQRLMSDVK